MASERTETALATHPAQTAITPMQMLQQAFEAAIKQGAGLEVVDRILKGQREMMEYQDRVAFNEALARVQAKARRVAANKENPQTHSRYANFAALDSVMRPLYIAEGFRFPLTRTRLISQTWCAWSAMRLSAAIPGAITSTCRPMARVPRVTT